MVISNNTGLNPDFPCRYAIFNKIHEEILCQKKTCFTRDLYRKIKAMDKAAMEQTLNNIYEIGAKDALDNAVIDLDIGKIRSEIGAVNGIGEKRLDQIMEIIKRNIAEADSKEDDSGSVKL